MMKIEYTYVSVINLSETITTIKNLSKFVGLSISFKKFKTYIVIKRTIYKITEINAEN